MKNIIYFLNTKICNLKKKNNCHINKLLLKIKIISEYDKIVIINF